MKYVACMYLELTVNHTGKGTHYLAQVAFFVSTAIHSLSTFKTLTWYYFNKWVFWCKKYFLFFISGLKLLAATFPAFITLTSGSEPLTSCFCVKIPRKLYRLFVQFIQHATLAFRLPISQTHTNMMWRYNVVSPPTATHSPKFTPPLKPHSAVSNVLYKMWVLKVGLQNPTANVFTERV